jgi:hypothetical protein
MMREPGKLYLPDHVRQLMRDLNRRDVDLEAAHSLEDQMAHAILYHIAMAHTLPAERARELALAFVEEFDPDRKRWYA